MKTNTARARKQKARNYGAEADLVRAMDCIVHTAADDSGMTDGQLLAIGWTACRGAACAAHSEPRKRGGVGEGRMRLFPACAVHHAEAGENSHIHGPSSKRRKFENLYCVNVGERADAIALGHEPPLGIRGLAARWVDWRDNYLEYMDRLRTSPATDVPEPLEGYDKAALFGWVRRRMEREVGTRRDLRLGTPSRPDYRPGDDWDGREDDCGLALSFAVGCDLGGVFQGPDSDELDGGQYVTDSLCQVAGWPS
jgi:hypothetical protein